jgi:hypothetical protein
VREAREYKQIIADAATGLDELPLLTAMMPRKTFFYDIVNRYRAKNIGKLVRDRADAIKNAKYLSSDGSFAGAWLFSILKDTLSSMSNSEFRVTL